MTRRDPVPCSERTPCLVCSHHSTLPTGKMYEQDISEDGQRLITIIVDCPRCAREGPAKTGSGSV